MRRSTERMLTTHTGSLPRPDDLVQMRYAEENGERQDLAAFEARVRSATAGARIASQLPW
jgi:5-methyltetrahydropteroyltriglutamate--homocysteine methyltransferase